MTSGSDELKPDRLIQDEDGTLIVDWPGGHQTLLSPEVLRLGCPCAMCNDERERSGHLRVEESASPSRFRIRKLERVGRYAISIIWGDGHSTGIYSWPVLRQLCPCFQCRLERGEA